MIYKFTGLNDDHTTVEFSRDTDLLIIETEVEGKKISYVILSKDDLFDLIGGLLRIQSEIKKEGGHK